MRFRKRIVVDFDGVLHSFIGPWTRCDEVNDGPTRGSLEAVQSYIDAGFEVTVVSARAAHPDGLYAIRVWLDRYGFPPLEITHEKLVAVLYIDDRGYHFTGDNFPSVEFLRSFKPWNRQPSDVEPYVDKEANDD